MGCASSKGAVLLTPPPACSNGKSKGKGKFKGRGRAGSRRALAGSLCNTGHSESGEFEQVSSNDHVALQSLPLQRNLRGHIEGEQIAAGWPAWLTNVAKEAIYGLVPQKAESYEKLGKVSNNPSK